MLGQASGMSKRMELKAGQLIELILRCYKM